jgi:hypothetical protein
MNPDLPDYIASMGARVSGVTGVFGTGQGHVGDPFRPGETILAAPDASTGNYTFWADLPSGKGEWLTQDLAEQWEWDIPCRLWLPRADLANMRRLTQPMYGRFADVFAADRQLAGQVQSCRISAFDIGSDDRWSWLDINLAVIETLMEG